MYPPYNAAAQLNHRQCAHWSLHAAQLFIVYVRQATMLRVTPSSARDCRGLPVEVLTQLLQDIEDQGGWHEAFQLKSLCAAKPEVYGLPGSALRRAVQNKTQRLKKLRRDAYLELLVSFGIVAFSHQRQRDLQRIQASSSQTGKGITSRQLKVVLQDIESNGGMHGVVSLRTICNRNPDLYGRPGTAARRVIQNKVQQLKLLNRVDYLQLLSAMGIQTAQA